MLRPTSRHLLLHQTTANGLLEPSSFQVWPRHVGAPLLRNTRKTERGAKQFLDRLAVRAAPFALLRNRYA